jgi:hypothetical protein
MLWHGRQTASFEVDDEVSGEWVATDVEWVRHEHGVMERFVAPGTLGARVERQAE